MSRLAPIRGTKSFRTESDALSLTGGNLQYGRTEDFNSLVYQLIVLGEYGAYQFDSRDFLMYSVNLNPGYIFERSDEFFFYRTLKKR